jgi:predicted RNA-binding protein with TRAM domain
LDTIIAENPFQPPGPPGKPIPTDYDFDHFDLKWDEPRHDGGSKITGYIIERRDADDDLWIKAAEVKSKLEIGTVKGLEEGQTYVFRVRAVNAAGAGNPGPESDNLTCRYKKLKPKIDRRMLKEITVRVGETIEFDVDLRGEPPPDVTWSKDGKSLSDTDMLRIKNKPYKTHFYIDEAVRKDDGNYLITAVNIHGKDMAEVRVNVHDRPGPPEGPMEITGETSPVDQLDIRSSMIQQEQHFISFITYSFVKVFIAMAARWLGEYPKMTAASLSRTTLWRSATLTLAFGPELARPQS